MSDDTKAETLATMRLTLDDYLYRLLAVSSSLVPPVRDRDAERAREIIRPLYQDAIERLREKRATDGEAMRQIATQLGWVPVTDAAERIGRLEDAIVAWFEELGLIARDYQGPYESATDRLFQLGRELADARRDRASAPNDSRNGVPQVSGAPANEKAPAEAGAQPTAVQGDTE